MENRIKYILLKSITTFLVAFVSSAVLAEQQKPLIEPDVKPVVLEESMIDTENFELGLFAGVINIEDFESSAIYSARLAYHLSENLMFESHFGMSEAGQSSIETLGAIEVLTNEDRDYQYYNLGLAYKLPGESYFGDSYAFNNNLYFSAGIGATDFAGDTRLTGMLGMTYQLLLTDYLSISMFAKEHFYKIDVVGPEKLSVNSELGLGISLFF